MSRLSARLKLMIIPIVVFILPFPTSYGIRQDDSPKPQAAPGCLIDSFLLAGVRRFWVASLAVHTGIAAKPRKDPGPL